MSRRDTSFASSAASRIMPLAVIAALLPAFGHTTLCARETVETTQVGKASYYGKRFDGRKTASGERFDSAQAVAAHPSWPLGTVVRVTNLGNNRARTVRIIDRGPNGKARRRGVIIDLSLGTARALGFVKQGITRVKLEVLKWGKQ